MITLASDCLLFQMPGGESMPFSAEMISVELLGGTSAWFDGEFVSHAAHAVFHFFKHEQGRQTVSVGEFAEALEKALRGLAPAALSSQPGRGEGDLCRLASESGEGGELFFFPRLRDELRRQLQESPRVVRFHGLRGCVKQLAGVRRWTPRCRTLEERIVEYMRQCLGAEAGRKELALIIE